MQTVNALIREFEERFQNQPLVTAAVDITMSEEPTVNASSLVYPDFNEEDPDRWFLSLEASFRAHGIRADYSKYACVLARLPRHVVSKIRPAVRQLPDSDTYGHIKAALLKAYTLSDRQKADKLIHLRPLGNQDPAEWLLDVEDLAGRTHVERPCSFMLRWIEHKLPDVLRLAIPRDEPSWEQIREAVAGAHLVHVEERVPAQVHALDADEDSPEERDVAAIGRRGPRPRQERRQHSGRRSPGRRRRRRSGRRSPSRRQSSGPRRSNSRHDGGSRRSGRGDGGGRRTGASPRMLDFSKLCDHHRRYGERAYRCGSPEDCPWPTTPPAPGNGRAGRR